MSGLAYARKGVRQTPSFLDYRLCKPPLRLISLHLPSFLSQARTFLVSGTPPRPLTFSVARSSAIIGGTVVSRLFVLSCSCRTKRLRIITTYVQWTI